MIDLQFKIVRNGSLVAAADNRGLADSIYDICLGEAIKGDTFSLADGNEIISAFDENGDEYIRTEKESAMK